MLGALGRFFESAPFFFVEEKNGETPAAETEAHR
jgi:hypothetical protein